MSNKIGKYTYENKSVLKEFLGSIIKAIAMKRSSKVMDKLNKDPEMKILLKRMDDRAKEVDKRVAKNRKTNPELDRLLKLRGL
jgi:proteasome assembly chaperone (PAC2) family protein